MAERGKKQVKTATSGEIAISQLVTTCCIVRASAIFIPQITVFPRKKFKPHRCKNEHLAKIAPWQNCRASPSRRIWKCCHDHLFLPSEVTANVIEMETDDEELLGSATGFIQLFQDKFAPPDPMQPNAEDAAGSPSNTAQLMMNPTPVESKEIINLENLRADPDAIFNLLDEIDSDLELGDDDSDWEHEPEADNSSDSSTSSDTDDDNLPNSSGVEPIAQASWPRRYFTSKEIPQESVLAATEVLTPWAYFSKYLGEDFLELAANKTAQYYLQKTGVEMKPSVTPEEIKKFFGIHAVIGCIKYPRIHMYWNKLFKLPIVADAMARDRFYQLRVNFHVEDNMGISEEKKKKNRLWKIQPMIDMVRNRCRELTRPEKSSFSIDEQMIPFLGRCPIRQYVQNKPRPVGLKNFVLTTSKGIVLDFEIYQGSTTPFENKDLGLGPSVVLHLVLHFAKIKLRIFRSLLHNRTTYE
ncbi:hypothetical protein Zmor_027960 [Zophobas morio]|uniref:PiggyBac transposable element-derived protein domain-containing protein n=1 Tax=Zophobas morio TaxID=2755281 RepID=A0AA38M2J1_9CUCU|nr:hypothetical protein Zmor_027960 [Zophobas morio]